MLAPAASPATAGPILDGLTVYRRDGTVYASVWVDDADQVPGQLYFINDSSLIDPDQFMNATALYEPGGNSTSGPFSYSFGVASPNPDDPSPDFFLGFQAGGIPIPDITYTAMEVAGASYDATRYLDSVLRVQGYTAVFQVDVVPEPGSLALLGLGTLVLGAYRRTVRWT